MSVLTFRAVPPEVSSLILARWEYAAGFGLMLGVFKRVTVLLLWLHMIGTMTPIFFFPSEVFAALPYAPALEGLSIIKNVVLISAGLVIGATVRGGKVVAEAYDAGRIVCVPRSAEPPDSA